MYYAFFKNILNPFFEYVVKRRNYLTYRSFMEKSQWWSSDKLRAYQWQELKKLLNHAYREVPYWRNKFQELGMTDQDIRTYHDFLKLPFTEKGDIRDNRKSMVARDHLGKTWSKATGGSTGEPLQLEYTAMSYDWRVACWKRGYSWTGCEDGKKQAWIWGVDIKPGTKFRQWKTLLHRQIFRQYYFNSFMFDVPKMEACLKELNRWKPEIIVGYTNPLYNFARFIEERGGLKFQPKSIICASETFHEFHREKLQEVFHCPVYNTYGCREFMFLAGECSERNGLHMSVENIFMEIIKPDGTPAKPGELGEVVITDLHNLGMPFIRYKIGDMAVPASHQCRCGRGLPMVKEIVGRTLDMVRTKDGKAVPGIFFPHLMKEYPGVKRFQVVQNSIDELLIKIVKTDELSAIDFDSLRSEIYKVMGHNIDIEFEFVEDIPLTPTGKYRVTVSNVKDEMVAK